MSTLIKSAIIVLAFTSIPIPAMSGVSAFLSAGPDCTGPATANFTPGGASVQVSLCVTTTTEQICNVSYRFLAASGESGRFNVAARTFAPAFQFSNLPTLAVPFPVNNPASSTQNTTDYGVGTTDGLPRPAASNVLIGTISLAPQITATASNYTLTLDPANAFVGVDQDGNCGAIGATPIDTPVSAAFTLARTIAPKITSDASATFTVGFQVAFTVTATGTPAPSFSRTDPLPTGVSFAATGVFSGTPQLGSVGTYPISIKAANGNVPDDTQNFTLVIQKANQAINFDPIADRAYSASSFAVVATATSGQTVTFTSGTTGVCGVSGTSVTLLTAGTCTVIANQVGTANYNAATLQRSFAVTGTHNVTPSVMGANGAISPTVVFSVGHGLTTILTITPSAGYSAAVTGTCGGTLVGSSFTTNPITGDCTVIASFSQITFVVTPSAGANGSISPNIPVTVNQGTSTTFTVIPAMGYLAAVGGSCGGNLAGNTYTTNAVTANCTVDATFAPALSLVSIVSRKMHGASAFEVTLNKNLAIGDAIPVEPRSIGAGHLIVFTFDSTVSDFGSVTVNDATPSPVGTAALSRSANEVRVTLTGIPDNKRVMISLSGVNGLASASAPIGFLVGDISGSRSVNASDISAVKAHLNQTADGSNFRSDVNANGTISSADVSAVKARSGLVMP